MTQSPTKYLRARKYPQEEINALNATTLPMNSVRFISRFRTRVSSYDTSEKPLQLTHC